MTTTTLRHPVRARRTVLARRRDEAGLSTAEYAVGTLGACSIAGILLKVAGSDWFMDIVKMIIENAFKAFL
ncbi:DUF4244 domain-containing protein [Solicola sp. PLA-1-18]|jgi:hypothetical protein|uniref:DUF4244 domain-containing protein n=1 Tax=Solicola sp. PLA-1-18 TaxID=3380532 RepID=UPI003B78938C